MKKALSPIALFALPLLTLACKPDLVVKHMEVQWDSGAKTAKAVIANIGSEDAGGFMVYFNGEEDPVSQNHRPQVRHAVEGLAKGASLTLTADFAPLAHPDNNHLGNVYSILVLVDPKHMVDESNEDNNQMEMQVSSSGAGCVDFEQQVDGTVYHRGDVFTDSGVDIYVRMFQWADGQWTTDGNARIGNGLLAGGSGLEVQANNVNLGFGLGGAYQKVSLLFGEYGGNLNIDIGGEFRNFANMADINGATIGGVNVAVVNGLGNDKGSLELSGTITSFTLGGQELFIDHLCYE